jgi:hypothetical protein
VDLFGSTEWKKYLDPSINRMFKHGELEGACPEKPLKIT